MLPAVCRIRIHGQASAYCLTKFASGWVLANLIDSLVSSVEFNEESGPMSMINAGDDSLTSLTTGRLTLFGPERFREPPKDHRLVIVMGQIRTSFLGWSNRRIF